MPNVNLRRLKTDEWEAHVQLMALASPFARNKVYWQWLNQAGFASTSDTEIYAEFEDEHLIATYALHFQTFSLQGKALIGAYATQALVHPAYRDLARITRLLHYAEECASQRNTDFIYGFPNQNMRLINQKMAAWQPIQTLEQQQLSSTTFESCCLSASPISFEAIADLPLLPDKGLARNLTAEYWCLRYQQHPNTHYFAYKIMDAAHTPLALCIAKHFNHPELGCIGHIVEMAYTKTFSKLDEKHKEYQEREIYAAAQSIFDSRIISHITTWSLKTGVVSKDVTLDSCVMMAKILNSTHCHIQDLTDMQIHMGMSDAF